MAAAAVLLTGTDRAIGQKKAPVEKAAPAKEQGIEEALDHPTELEFTDAPLSDVIKFLKNYHNIEIQIDQKALEDAGLGSDTPVTQSIKGVSLLSALNLVLRDLGLTYTVENEVLLITTPEKAEERLIARVYPVADLVVCRDEAGQRWENYRPLVAAIESLCPQSWDHSGGVGTIRPGTFGTARVLVISQTYQAHRDVAKLLERIREIARQDPSDEPPLRSRPGGAPMGMGAPGMGGMGGGMMGPGMGGMGGGMMGPGMGGMGGGMMGPGMGGPGMGAPPTAAPRKPAAKPRQAEHDDPFAE
jgi:hypothetical protein